MVEHTMDVVGWLRKQLEETQPDLLRAMVKEQVGLIEYARVIDGMIDYRTGELERSHRLITAAIIVVILPLENLPVNGLP